MNKFIIPLLVIFCTMTYPVWAIDGISITRGVNESNRIDVTRLGISWDSSRQWPAEGDWNLVRYWQLELGYWESSEETSATGSLVELGVTPVYRMLNHGQARLQPWFEVGVGVHFISETKIAGRDLSSAFQFGSHIGAGVSFGANRQYEIGYRLQHLSNGGIKGKNDGVNMHLFHLGYHF